MICPTCGIKNDNNLPLRAAGQVIRGGCQSCWETQEDIALKLPPHIVSRDSMDWRDRFLNPKNCRECEALKFQGIKDFAHCSRFDIVVRDIDILNCSGVADGSR